MFIVLEFYIKFYLKKCNLLLTDSIKIKFIKKMSIMNLELNANATTETLVINNKAENLQKKKDAKKSVTNVEKKKIVTKESKQGEKILAKLNLDKFTSKVANFEGKIKNVKSTIYIYPDTISEIQKQGNIGRAFRRTLRKKMEIFVNNVCLYYKHKRTNDLISEVKEFQKFYKDNYRLNDYKVASVSESNNPAILKEIQNFLDIVSDIIIQLKGK